MITLGRGTAARTGPGIGTSAGAGPSLFPIARWPGHLTKKLCELLLRKSCHVAAVGHAEGCPEVSDADRTLVVHVEKIEGLLQRPLIIGLASDRIMAEHEEAAEFPADRHGPKGLKGWWM